MKRRTLLRQYFLAFGAILLVNLALATWLIVEQTGNAVVDEWHYQLNDMADRAIADYQRRQLSQLTNAQWAAQNNQPAVGNLSGVYVAAYEPTGDTNQYNPQAGWSDDLAAGLIGDRAATVLAGQRLFWLSDNQALLAVSTRTTAGRPAILLLGLPRRTDMALVLRFGRPVLLGLLAVSLPTLLLALVFFRRITRPVTRMAGMAEAVAQGDFRQRIEQPGQNEIGDLGRSLNQMAAQLAAAEQGRRILLSGLSHELRTPLTIIKANTRGILDGVVPPAEQADYLQATAAETERLGMLIENYLQSATLPAEWPLNRQLTDLADLARRVVRQMALPTGQALLRLDLQAPAQMPVRADGYQLRQVLINLLDNAMHYSPPGGVIKVVLMMEPGFAVLTVQDRGPGIPPELLPSVCEPLVKGADSKGSGLGLYLCRRIVEAHHGSILLESAPGGGVCVTVRLPATGADTESPAVS